jgi:hypothetical protein
MAADEKQNGKQDVFFHLEMFVIEKDGHWFAIVKAPQRPQRAFGPLPSKEHGEGFLNWCADVVDDVLRGNGVGEMLPQQPGSNIPN